MNRESKVLCIAILSYITYSSFLAYVLPFRATTDEANPMMDVYALFQDGSISGQFAYINGAAYQSGITAILRVTGLEPVDTEFLSPVIGALGLGFIATVLLVMYRESAPRRPWWGGISFLLVLIVIPGFVNRIRETSHKTFTFSLVFLGLLLAFWAGHQRSDRRYHLLAIMSILPLSAFNFVWGAIYGTIIAISYLANESRAPWVLALPALASYVVVFFLPAVELERGYFIGTISILLANGASGSPTESGGSGGLLAGWPTLVVGDITISWWFIFASGVFFIALLTVIANTHIIASYLFSKSKSPLGLITFVVSVVSGVITIGLFVAGDIATVKRMIILPGVLGTVYVAAHLAPAAAAQGVARSRFGAFSTSSLIILLAILLVVGAALGLPRVMLDGHQKPIDVYADDNELAQVSWIVNHESACLKGVGTVDWVLGPKLAGEWVSVPGAEDRMRNKVYSSGRDGVVFCERPMN